METTSTLHSKLKNRRCQDKNQKFAEKDQKMPVKEPSPAVTPQSEAEALVILHALAFYRDIKQQAKNAPFELIKKRRKTAEKILLLSAKWLFTFTLLTAI